MFKILKALLRRVDLYLRNEPFTDPSEDDACPACVPFDDLFDNPKNDPVRTRVYWSIRRFWINHWLCNPRAVYFDVKCAYQRVTRGWDDRAAWSVDWWLDEKMPGILRLLKEKKHGIPCSMFPTEPEYINEHGNATDAAFKIAEVRWDGIMDKMIAGFEANRRISDMTYPELGDYPLFRPEGVTKEAWEKVKDDHYEASKLLMERDEKIYKEGMALFVEHYRSLWD